MAPTKSKASKAKPTALRKSTRRKGGANARAAAPSSPSPRDKENAAPNAANANTGESSPATDFDDDHEKNWWAMNYEKAAKLIERCMKYYGWTREETKRIFKSYRQFLLLKKEHEDWDDKKLEPCWPVDSMWLQHKEMEDHDYDMRTLLGHVINRSPDAADNQSLYKSTKEALKERFGSYDEEVWDEIHVVVVDQLGEKRPYYINRRSPLLTIFEMFAQGREEDLDKYQFFFNGEIIVDGKDATGEKKDNMADDATPMRLGMEHGAVVQANRVDKVAVTLRSSSAPSGKVLERSYLADKTDMISRTLDEYAKDALEAERDGFVFLNGGKRIFGFESPVALGLECRGNVVDVVPVESYKCERCECCNPRIHPGQ